MYVFWIAWCLPTLDRSLGRQGDSQLRLMAARASATEAERDAAIEEAAQAIFCLQRARKELEALKRSVSDQQNQCNCCCSSTKSHQEGRGGQHSSQQLAEREVATTRNGA